MKTVLWIFWGFLLYRGCQFFLMPLEEQLLAWFAIFAGLLVVLFLVLMWGKAWYFALIVASMIAGVFLIQGTKGVLIFLIVLGVAVTFVSLLHYNEAKASFTNHILHKVIVGRR